jgi:hypothetical protein
MVLEALSFAFPDILLAVDGAQRSAKNQSPLN